MNGRRGFPWSYTMPSRNLPNSFVRFLAHQQYDIWSYDHRSIQGGALTLPSIIFVTSATQVFKEEKKAGKGGKEGKIGKIVTYSLNFGHVYSFGVWGSFGINCLTLIVLV